MTQNANPPKNPPKLGVQKWGGAFLAWQKWGGAKNKNLKNELFDAPQAYQRSVPD